MSFRRTADPATLARTSKLVKAWERRTREKAAGDELYDEHWYAFLMTMARPVPPPACSQCDDSGIVELECTIRNRCLSWRCEHPDKRSDPLYTHTYVRACSCAAGQPYQRSFAASQQDAPKPAAKKTSYGSNWRQAAGGRS
jgi:hypothetical protein